MIDRYFVPSLYDEHGYMPFVQSSAYQANLFSDYTVVHVLYVSKYSIFYYAFRWIDTSLISLIDLATNLADYKVDYETSSSRAATSEG